MSMEDIDIEVDEDISIVEDAAAAVDVDVADNILMVDDIMLAAKRLFSIGKRGLRLSMMSTLGAMYEGMPRPGVSVQVSEK
jgi:hypothetical protein